jgi:hypothetical protein
MEATKTHPATRDHCGDESCIICHPGHPHDRLYVDAHIEATPGTGMKRLHSTGTIVVSIGEVRLFFAAAIPPDVLASKFEELAREIRSLEEVAP